MNSDYDVYDYDQSLFFRLLDSAKFRFKFEFVQQKQGLVVCPLELKSTHVNTPKKQNDLVDTHLYLPSPFYKNHYIPLNSLNSLASSSEISNDSFLLDHSSKIYLVLNQSDDQQMPDMILKHNHTQICKNVKLLNVQTAFTENKKTYKILIVNKHLRFTKKKSPTLNRQQLYQSQQQSRFMNGNHSDLDEENGGDENDINLDNDNNSDHFEVHFLAYSFSQTRINYW